MTDKHMKVAEEIDEAESKMRGMEVFHQQRKEAIAAILRQHYEPRPAQESVCAEIMSIMEEYDRQEKEHGYVETPGGLEQMGDVWRLLQRWRDQLAIKHIPGVS